MASIQQPATMCAQRHLFVVMYYVNVSSRSNSSALSKPIMFFCAEINPNPHKSNSALFLWMPLSHFYLMISSKIINAGQNSHLELTVERACISIVHFFLVKSHLKLCNRAVLFFPNPLTRGKRNTASQNKLQARRTCRYHQNDPSSSYTSSSLTPTLRIVILTNSNEIIIIINFDSKLHLCNERNLHSVRVKY